jgi:LuxR family maltose regulon positive regulatory protein
MPEAAFVHAVAADDIDTGTRLLDGYVIMNLESGEFRIVERWLDSTPPAWFSANPSLGLYQGALKAFQGDIDGLVQVLDEAEAQIAAQNRDDASLQLAKITVARCAAACFQNNVPLAERYASQALAGLRPEDDTLRANIHHALADSYRRNHRWSEAREHYLRIITTLTTDPSWKVRSAHVYGALADLELMQGRLREAHDLWNKARAAIEQPRVWGLLPVPIIGWVYIRLAELLYEWNALTEASALLPKGLERAELGGDVRAMIAGHLIAGRMALSEGDLERAGEHLERASPLVDQSAFTEWNSRFERLQLELWLVQNRLRAAVEWSDRMQLDDAHSLEPEGDVTQLAIARVLIFKGDADARMQALDRLATTIDVAMRDERKGVLIEALALQAIALSAAGDVAGAMTSLERALGLAEPEGYLRVFADLGLPMARVLQEARSRSVMPEYVDRLLACVAGDLGEASSRTEVLVEPLSARELEVLGLIAAGLTNREIAAKLFISAETVKKHTSSIYAKLQVKHRTEAIARARELHLLQP